MSAVQGGNVRVGERIRSLREEVMSEIRRMVLDGTLPAGEMLNETALAGELGVSRLPVREAFRQLEAEGLLETVARRGVRVVAPDSDEFDVIHEARLALELLALRLAVKRAEPASFAAISDALARGEKAALHDDEQVLDELNERFHGLIAEASGSRSLAEMLRMIRQRSELYARGKHSPAVLSWGEHSAIMRAILARDSRGATSLMRAHLVDRHDVAVASLV